MWQLNKYINLINDLVTYPLTVFSTSSASDATTLSTTLEIASTYQPTEPSTYVSTTQTPAGIELNV